MYNITAFEADYINKVPISPFGDKTFIFRTRKIKTHFEFLNIIGKYFILNQPFKDSGEEFDFRDYRRVSTLKDKFQDVFEYIILDIDDVISKENMQSVLNYFKEYKVILGESYSHNGIDNFRLKGVLFCEPGNIREIQNALNTIAQDLRMVCSIDTSRGFIPSFNAPARKNKPILNNETGKLWKHNKIQELTVLPKLSELEIKKLQEKKENPTIVKHTTQDFNEAESIQDIALMYFENLGFEALETITKDGIDYIRFKHPSEVKTPGGFTWNKDNPYYLSHWNQERGIDAFKEINQIPRTKELIKQSLNYDSELLSYNPRTKLIKVNERYLSVTPEIQEHIHDFIESDKGIFSIKSPMGTGKSTIIKDIIDTAQDYGLRCLIITNRISVAEDFKEKYDIKIYNNYDNKYQKGDSLICQFDSLWKYDLKDFDLVIMDEFISLMMHSRSSLKNSSLNIIKFFSAFDKKLVIADAFLTGYERFLLDKNVDNNSYLLDNEYRDSTVLYDYENKNQFVLKLLSVAKEHKITVSATSLRFLEDVRSLLQDNGLRTVSLTAETPEHTKELIYETFKEDHDKYDVLLYSPTLTVGVSNLNSINYHFHFDSSISADVISSLQMIKRTRKAKEIHLFVRDSFNYLITDYQKLRTHYLNNVGSGDFSILFEVNQYGDVQISEIGKKVLKIDVFKNILETNHKGAMLWLLKYHFKNPPRVITKSFGANILQKYTKQNREDSKKIQKELVKEFLSLSSADVVDMQDTNQVLNKMADIHENMNIMKIESSGLKDFVDNIKTRILNKALEDSDFILSCKRYVLFKNYLNGVYGAKDLRYRMQGFITNSDIENTHFCSKLMSLNIPYSHEYEMKELRAKNINYILTRCGYKKASSLGRRYMKIDKDVMELSEYISEF